MVRIAIDRDSGGSVRGFSIRGHAFAADQGSDIVCAAISALSQTTVLGLERRLGIAAGIVAGAGSLTCRLPDGLDEAVALRAQDLLETMCLGLRAVAATYPQRAIIADAAATAPGARRRGLLRAGKPAGVQDRRPAADPGASGPEVARRARGTREGDDNDGANVDV